MSLVRTITTYKSKLYDWAKANAEGRGAKLWLAAIAFSESSFFLIPPDVMLIAILLAGARRWWYWASLATLASVLGGVFGYLIGFALWDLVGAYLVDLYGLHEQVARVAELYRRHEFWAVFISAFTPIPYKVFTISAGLFRVDLFIFIIASLLGRAIRFGAIGYVVEHYGKEIVEKSIKYSNIITVAVVIIIALVLLL